MKPAQQQHGNKGSLSLRPYLCSLFNSIGWICSDEESLIIRSFDHGPNPAFQTFNFVKQQNGSVAITLPYFVWSFERQLYVCSRPFITGCFSLTINSYLALSTRTRNPSGVSASNNKPGTASMLDCNFEVNSSARNTLMDFAVRHRDVDIQKRDRASLAVGIARSLRYRQRLSRAVMSSNNATWRKAVRKSWWKSGTGTFSFSSVPDLLD